MRAWRELNSQPLGPQPNALSIKLQAHGPFYYIISRVISQTEKTCIMGDKLYH